MSFFKRFIRRLFGLDFPSPVVGQIWHATGGEVTRQEMCPDDWQSIWPELVSTTQATQNEPAVHPLRAFSAADCAANNNPACLAGREA